MRTAPVASGCQRAIAAGAAVFCLIGYASDVVLTAPPVRAPVEGNAATGRRDADYLYRIVGKVRPLFFWISADNVGGARITRRDRGAEQSLALLIGSEPSRAPRGINEWGYIREDSHAGLTRVFGIRTVTDGDSPAAAEARRAAAGKTVELGVLCSTVSRGEAVSRTTTVYVAPEAMYRNLDTVLGVVERSRRWNGLRTGRPSDTAPGFLTAIDAVMRATAIAAQTSGVAPKGSQLAYVYKDAVYDLAERRIERVPLLQTESGAFRDLLRSQVVVKNRSTGSSTEFVITYGTRGSLFGIPVAAVYQPNWWFKVEIELDDHQDVPPDPSDDASVSRRIAGLCSHDAE